LWELFPFSLLAIVVAALGWCHPVPKAGRWWLQKDEKVAGVNQL